MRFAEVAKTENAARRLMVKLGFAAHPPPEAVATGTFFVSLAGRTQRFHPVAALASRERALGFRETLGAGLIPSPARPARRQRPRGLLSLQALLPVRMSLAFGRARILIGGELLGEPASFFPTLYVPDGSWVECSISKRMRSSSLAWSAECLSGRVRLTDYDHRIGDLKEK